MAVNPQLRSFARMGVPVRHNGSMAFLTMLVLAILLVPLSASAHTLTDEELKGVGFTQHPGNKLPLGATFVDESRRSVHIGDYFKDRPVILTLNYLRCPNLCPIILSSLAADLNGLPFTLGDQYTVLTVSIDPRDTPAQAVDMRAKALQMYERSGGEDGWHILTGTQDQVDLLANAVGFQYQYDADQDEYAHPAGVIVLTPDGTISRYLYGLDFSPNDLRLALVEAAQRHIGTVVDQVLLTCFHYDAQVGRYTPMVLNAMRLAGVLTVLILGGFLGFLWLRTPRSPPEPGHAGG